MFLPNHKRLHAYIVNYHAMLQQMPSIHAMLHCVTELELRLLHAVVKLDPKADFNQMKVSQLKQLLKDRGVDSKDCIEKPDFVQKVQQLAATAA